MPECYRESIDEKTQIAVWNISEPEEELEKGLALSKQALKTLSQRKSTDHRKGYLAIKQLLKIFDVDPLAQKYDENGAPFLIDGRCLSISHTKDVAAVVIASTPVGIDLEHYQEKIKKIAPRFLHKNETDDPVKCSDTFYLTQIWTAKEALYKIFRKPGIKFKTQLRVAPFNPMDPEGIGLIFNNGETHFFSLHFRYFKDFCLSLATINNDSL